MTAWILVCDVARAKLFSTELRETPWTLVEEFDHPEGHETSREISPSSPPGRMQVSHVAGARRSAMEPHSTPKEVETEHFARELAKYLEQATSRRAFDTLYLAAPPRMLGTLRGLLDAQTEKLVRAAVDKDLSMFDAKEVRERLVDVVFP